MVWYSSYVKQQAIYKEYAVHYHNCQCHGKKCSLGMIFDRCCVLCAVCFAVFIINHIIYVSWTFTHYYLMRCYVIIKYAMICNALMRRDVVLSSSMT